MQKKSWVCLVLHRENPHMPLWNICPQKSAAKKTVPFIDSLGSEEQNSILKRVVSFSRKKRAKLRLRQKELRLEISKREAVKSQKRDTTERNKLEKQLKNSDLT